MKKRLPAGILIFAALCLFTVNTCLAAAQDQQVLLYGDFSFGDQNPKPEDIRTYPQTYSGDLTPDVFTRGLSTLTGLDFFADITVAEDEVRVYWADDSTLTAGLDDRPQKEEFHFFDAQSLNWFMMDSLWQTLTHHYGVDVYYCSADGGDLTLPEDTHPVSSFPAEVPYQGSAHYMRLCTQEKDPLLQEEILPPDGPVLVGNLPKDAELTAMNTDEAGNYTEILSVDGGLITITLARRVTVPKDTAPEDTAPVSGDTQLPLVTPRPIEILLAEFYPDITAADFTSVLEPVTTAAVPAAKRVQFSWGQNEDSSVVDATALYTENYDYLFIAKANMDAYYGFYSEYQEGDIQELFDMWTESLDLFE